ncbi:hypothetical protein RP20_CCG011995 [Aedes albopictus]|nr:hypothetical protein RP20_CCG011995 [Aedes albopictus]
MELGCTGTTNHGQLHVVHIYSKRRVTGTVVEFWIALPKKLYSAVAADEFQMRLKLC